MARKQREDPIRRGLVKEAVNKSRNRFEGFVGRKKGGMAAVPPSDPGLMPETRQNLIKREKRRPRYAPAMNAREVRVRRSLEK